MGKLNFAISVGEVIFGTSVGKLNFSTSVGKVNFGTSVGKGLFWHFGYNKEKILESNYKRRFTISSAAPFWKPDCMLFMILKNRKANYSKRIQFFLQMS
jgi:hypothetical protein